MALWGGRFESQPDALFRAINDSLPVDYRLARQDIRGSIAWARAIHKAGVLSAEELKALEGALTALDRRVMEDPELPLRGAAGPGQDRHTYGVLPASGSKAKTQALDEDVHSWVERNLIETLGPLGKKLHTGRSRNDQVATDFRLWTRDAIDARVEELRAARKSLIDLAAREPEAVIPGYTHLQRAQPVLFAHWCLAHEAGLERDTQRFLDARRRVNICPLGSGALAGTAYAIDRDALARDLGFDAPTTNSLDGVSDRDFVIETLAAAAICATHLSRLGEDLVLYASQEFGFIEMHDSVASGSSLMPQKKNPDAAELLRGKAGRIVGPLVSLLVSVKGLPLAYNKDLQEDKGPLFDAMDHLSLALAVVPPIVSTLTLRRDVALAAAQGGYSNATDLADYFVSKGMPFREAHDAVGRIVRHALAQSFPIEKLTLDEIREHAPSIEKAIGPDVYERISLEAGLAKRNVAGGTGREAVARALAAAHDRLLRETKSAPRRSTEFR